MWRSWRSRKTACPVPPAVPVFLESFSFLSLCFHGTVQRAVDSVAILSLLNCLQARPHWLRNDGIGVVLHLFGGWSSGYPSRCRSPLAELQASCCPAPDNSFCVLRTFAWWENHSKLACFGYWLLVWFVCFCLFFFFFWGVKKKLCSQKCESDWHCKQNRVCRIAYLSASRICPGAGLFPVLTSLWSQIFVFVLLRTSALIVTQTAELSFKESSM